MEYFCPKEGCVKEFKDRKSLEQHLLLYDCDYKLEKLSDKAKVLCSEKLDQNVSSCCAVTMKMKESIQSEVNAEMGWALKMKKKKTMFSKAQKDFLIEKFNTGKICGRKVDPYTAAEEMRLSDKFKKDEFLTAQQIGSFFSRLTQQEKRNQDENDLRAAEEEDIKMNIKREILSALENKQEDSYVLYQ